MAYQPIQNYGVIGDMHTVALVGMNGSIDWLCFPHFDSPSLFGALLDDEKGGRFQIAPVAASITHKQLYWPDTNVLITRFLAPDGVAEVIDFMPVGKPANGHGYHQLIRIVNGVRGSLTFRLECCPAFNYARDPHTVHITPVCAHFHSPSQCICLSSPVPLTRLGSGVHATFTVNEQQSLVFVLAEAEAVDSEHPAMPSAEGMARLQETEDYWQRWLAQCTYTGRWRETVYRSALVLKLLTFEPTGAIVAAPTTSLPETLGGSRNWDYRYTWMRDAAFTVYALMRIGFNDEAAHFMRWLEERCHEPNPDGSLQIVYGIDGRHTLTEEVLDHLTGYKGSRPVRIGNAASSQMQLDIYGELMDAVYLYNKYGSPISYDFWVHLRRLTNWVCDNWQRPDEGIWEMRGGKRHFVFSKLMCWVALDRALRLADKRSFPADRERWLATRDQIYEEIMYRGWSPTRQAFRQHYDSDALDASALIMPLVFFVAPNDPRMLRTLDAINRSPARGGLVANSLVYRYHVRETQDGLEGEEGTFNMCTFWLVEALTRAGRTDPTRLDEARQVFERMLGFANHLGLYAEETGLSGEALGNFPQAFTHISLISAAFNLDRALSGH